MVRYYCADCGRNVGGKKTFHGVAFILLMVFVWFPLIWIEFLGFLGSGIGYNAMQAYGMGTMMILSFFALVATGSAPIIYFMYHKFKKTPRCPICNMKLENPSRK